MPGLTPKGRKSEASGSPRFLPEIVRAELPEHVLAVRWSPDSRLLAAVPLEGEISVIDAAGHSHVRLAGHRPENSAAAWHPFRNLLATCGQDNVVRLWDSPSPEGAPTREFEAGKGWVESLAWNRDGSRLALGAGRSLMVFDPRDGRRLESWDSHKSTVCDLAWSPDGRWIATGDQTPSAHIYDVPARNPLHIQGYPAKIRALAWHPHGEWLATAAGGSIVVWPCTGQKGPDGATPITLDGHSGSVGALDFAPVQTVLVSGGRDGLVLLWLPLKSDTPALLAREESEITDIRFSPDLARLAVGTANGGVSILSLSKFLK